MDGQEAVEVLFSTTVSSSYGRRIDSNFFLKEFVFNTTNRQTVKLSEECTIRSGITPVERDDELKEGVILLKTNEIRNSMLGEDNSYDYYYIDQDTNLGMGKTQIHKFDVLINIVGASTDVIGRTALVMPDFPKANITQAMALLRLNHTAHVNPFYLFTFLSSKYGNKQVRRLARPTGQYNLNLEELGSFEVPILSEDFQILIKQTIEAIHTVNLKEKSFYARAESLLLERLNLSRYTPTQKNSSSHSFSSAFGAAGRMDAEFFEPRFDELDRLINQNPTVRLGDIVKSSISSGSTPKAGDEFFYTDDSNETAFIRAVNLKDSQVEAHDLIYLRDEVSDNLLKRTKLKYGDVLFSIAGTVGRCAVFEHEFKANINQAVAILRLREDGPISSLYLTTFFNSSIGTLYTSRYSRQGLQSNMNLVELANLKMPILALETQKEIETLVRQSFTAQQTSSALLELAKRGVEKAIEDGEDAATAWLEAELRELGVALEGESALTPTVSM